MTEFCQPLSLFNVRVTPVIGSFFTPETEVSCHISERQYRQECFCKPYAFSLPRD